ncbi:MAG: MarC family protein [Bacteroidales bacterium]|nr:MarC family protein [Bacteroidales bacterium]
MWESIAKDFIYFFAVIDPVGTIPVFLAYTVGFNASMRIKVAWKAILISTLILLGFIVSGQIFLEAMSIPLSAFQIAGGLVLFIFGLTMIFGESKPEHEMSKLNTKKSEDDVAVFPISVPSIASPGAMMAAVLLTDNHRFDMMDQAITAGTMLVVLGVTLLLLLFATRIQKVIGDTGASILSRISGLILASVAVDSVLTGIKMYF